MHPVKRNAKFTHHYDRYWHDLNLDGLSYPTPIKQVRAFERNNTHLSVNILGYEGAVFIPLYRTINRNVRHKRKTITLLLFKGHYYFVRNMSRLLNHHDPKRRGRSSSWYCHSCLCRYNSLQSLRDHETLWRGPVAENDCPVSKTDQIRTLSAHVYVTVRHLLRHRSDTPTRSVFNNSRSRTYLRVFLYKMSERTTHQITGHLHGN